MVTAPPAVCDSAVSSYFHDCPAFLHRHFPPQSPPSHPPHPSLQVNSSPHPGIAPQSLNPSSQPLRRSTGPASLFRVCMAVARAVWFSFYLSCHRSDVSLSALNVSFLTHTVVWMWGSDPCFSSPPTKGRASPTETPVFPTSSFILPNFVWFYIFFSASQILLSALSWCSACTSVSEMYSWCIHEERCSPHPPTPLPSSPFHFLKIIFWLL